MDERVEVASAAVSTEEIGNPVYPPAKACLVRHGIPLDSAKRARQITRGDYDAYDHIICMDRSNLRLLRHIIPDDPAGKVSLMMSWTGEARDVADPWYTGDFEMSYRDILAGCEALLRTL